MGDRLRSWWKQIKAHRVAIEVVAIVFVVVIVLIIVGYWFDWTGFNGYNKITVAHTISGTNTGTVIRTEEYLPGKALWDWLQLLIIPLVLAVVALLYNLANTRTERQIAKQRYEQDQHIALDKQREELLQIYLDRISELLLEKNLRTSPSEEVRNVARVRTTTILTQLDERRIGYVFAFLLEAGLMSTTSNDNAVSLSGADLHAVNWSHAGLSRANLSGVKLWEANLSGTDLEGANLSEADLLGANLSDAGLWEADFSGAELEGADLSGANLKDAKVTDGQLKKAKSLKGATMPDGTIHE